MPLIKKIIAFYRLSILVLSMLFCTWMSRAQTPFECDGKFYLNIGTLSQGSIEMVILDTGSLGMTTVATTSVYDRNILAYNYVDNFIYSIHVNDYDVYRIDAAGNHTNLGAITGIAGSVTMHSGDFDSNGVLVISGYPANPNIYRIDVTTNPPSVISSAPRTFSSGSGLPGFADFAYNRLDGKFYGVETTTQRITEIDPVTGVITPTNSNATGVIVGATFFGPAHDKLYVYGRYPNESQSSRLFRCDLAGGNCVFVAQGITSGNIDGCSCNLTCDSSFSEVSDTICLGDTYAFQDSSYTTTGNYEHILLSTNGCDSVVTLNLFVHPTKDSTVLQPVSICEGDSQLIFGSYRKQAGVFYDTLINANGCDSILIQQLSLINAIETVLEDLWICEGNQTEVFGYQQSVSGIYYDTLMANAGCDSIVSVSLLHHPNPVVKLSTVPESCPGESDGGVLADPLIGKLPFYYEWNTGSKDAKLSQLSAGLYTLTITDGNDCSSYQEILVPNEVNECATESAWVPNIFSPNNDGNNDVFHVSGSNFRSIHMIIFDRWGHVVFESEAPAVGWDGTYDGKDLNPGTYVYQVVVTDAMGEETKLRGNVTLVR